jgi:hypothetical protein
LAGPDLHAGAISQARQNSATSASKIAASRVRRGLPHRMRRLLLLSVPHPAVLAETVHRRPGFAAIWIQSAGGDHRAGVARARAIRRPCGARQSFVPERGSLPGVVSRLTRALSRPHRRPHLRVRLVPARIVRA